MERSKPTIAAVFTILGIIIGAGVNNYFASQREINSDLFAARLEAYVAFMNGQALREKAITDDEHKAANTQIMKAKFSLAMLSGQPVLQAMVDYWSQAHDATFEKCSDENLRITDAAIYQKIREEMIRAESSKIEPAVMVPFLWNCKVTEK